MHYTKNDIIKMRKNGIIIIKNGGIVEYREKMGCEHGRMQL